ncbi:outer membrane protein [Rhodopseudomonas parapalustris]
MKKFLLCTTGMIALSAPASAADMAARPYTKAPPPIVAAMYDWSGFYIGANAGWGQSRDNRYRTDRNPALDLGAYNANGATAGGQIGYRWQTGAWVFGVEAQGNWADFHGSIQNQFNLANQIYSKTDAFGLFTGQVGYAWNNILLYVKGGAAVTDRQYEFISNATGAATAVTDYHTRWSGTVGGGFEIGFAPNWSIGVEYNHIFENRHDVQFNSAATGAPIAGSYESGGDTDLVLARINYRWGGPVVARY